MGGRRALQRGRSMNPQPPRKRKRRGSEKRHRNFSVRVRLDGAERGELEARAGALSLPAYFRKAGLGSAGARARRRRVNGHLLARALADLHRVGSNLNQIARILNIDSKQQVAIRALQAMRVDLYDLRSDQASDR
jgi:hypothetical protein